jgi:hypothetical protein
MKKKILLVSWTIPPEPTGSAVIVGNLAKQFSSHEMIIAGERPFRRPNSVWRKDWPQLKYVAAGWPPTWRGARWWRALQIPLIVLLCLRLALKHRCSIIIAVFPNEVFLLTGYLTALCTGACFFPYFHNTWVENRDGVARRFANIMQSRIFMRSEHVFLMSQGMVELFRERYPSIDCSALIHSFNEELPQFEPPPAPRSPLRVTIAGTIHESCRDATVRVCEAISCIENAQLTFLTGTPRANLEKLNLLKDGACYRSVSSDHVIANLREADIVILPHGFTGGYSPEEYRTMFPTKTIEYLLCGRPILAHAPPNCYLTRFLSEHQCARIVDSPSVPALVEGLHRLRYDSQLRSDLVRNALCAAKIFHAPRVAKTVRKVLEKHNNGFCSQG